MSNNYRQLVRQCLEDLSGKDASEASNSEWKCAEREVARMITNQELMETRGTDYDKELQRLRDTQ